MNITDELRKLADLREAGHLTEEEFAQAKRRLLTDGTATATAEIPSATVATPVPASELIEPRRYRSSRWSSGNFFFPDALTLAGDGMLFRKGALFSSNEEHINYRAIASYRVKNGIFLADLTIETSGGSQPIHINGLWKSDAREIQATLRQHQIETK